MRYYSFAGKTRGNTNPDETYCVNVHENECTLRGCTKDNCDHIVIMWSGGEYSKNNTWIAVNDDYAVNLEDVR